MKTRRAPAAFTLVELLTVMAVMIILVGLIVPAVGPLLRGTSMTQAGEMVGDQFVLARQNATTTNRPVEVRFYELPVTSASKALNYCAMQSFRLEESGKTTALTKLQPLRTGVVFAGDSQHSSILAPPNGLLPSVKGKETLPAFPNNGQQCNYVGFRFLPNGSTDLDPTAAASGGGWFITLVEANKLVPTDKPPTNYYTLAVGPLDGSVRLFRP